MNWKSLNVVKIIIKFYFLQSHNKIIILNMNMIAKKLNYSDETLKT